MHYTSATLPAQSMKHVLNDGDTYKYSPTSDEYTYVGTGIAGRWVATKLLPQPSVPPTAPSGTGGFFFCSIWGMSIADLNKEKADILTRERSKSVASEASDKLPPMTCSEGCGFTNEYVGKEHLVNGSYVCRQCRPRYERRQRTLALKATNEEAASNPYAY